MRRTCNRRPLTGGLYRVKVAINKGKRQHVSPESSLGHNCLSYISFDKKSQYSLAPVFKGRFRFRVKLHEFCVVTDNSSLSQSKTVISFTDRFSLPLSLSFKGVVL